MSTKTIYVVSGNSRNYDCTNYWNLKAFTNKEKACNLADNAQEEADRLLKEYP
jgi:hypothetical protein